MRSTLLQWIDAFESEAAAQRFQVTHSAEGGPSDPTAVYFALVGELFTSFDSEEARDDWLTLGNAFSEFAERSMDSLRTDARFFAAVAYYMGGYSASALLSMRRLTPGTLTTPAHRTCHDLLARPAQMESDLTLSLIDALRDGDTGLIRQAVARAREASVDALALGPDEWVAAKAQAELLQRFATANVRAVLPESGTFSWDPLVNTFLDRQPPMWDFFPSQVEAIDAGVLANTGTYTLQMPTGSGKTALTETLMFGHLAGSQGEIAVLLVPYRALARELRDTLARRLNRLGLTTRTVFGGTVPTAEEGADLEGVAAIIATPESFSGLIGSNPELLDRLTLVVVDEGHLLDQPGRGVGLELLLARLKARPGSNPRLVFLSAIVPNVEEINSWLGGSAESAVTSRYRPTQLDFGVLRTRGTGVQMSVDLAIEPTERSGGYRLRSLLSRSDFRYVSSETGHQRTYNYGTVKSRAVAAARKSVAFGATAVYSANKSGNQGVEGLADELMTQLDAGLSMPAPETSAQTAAAHDYLTREFGARWIGTRAMSVGAAVHHGDVPQEAREVIEELITEEELGLVFCTNTLAEGVNLPIRTLVLYSVRRSTAGGDVVRPLARDVQNLVGRAGRPGSTTRGLIICANSGEWSIVRPVSAGDPGEDLHGFLRTLLRQLRAALRNNGVTLTNGGLEATPELHALVDGVDTALLELMHEELGLEEFKEQAEALANETLAWRTGGAGERALLGQVMALRSERLTELRDLGRLRWARSSGTRPRLLDTLIDDLADRLPQWTDATDPANAAFLADLLTWALEQPEFEQAVADAYRTDNPPSPSDLASLVATWLGGATCGETASAMNMEIADFLRVHSGLLGYALPTLVEQAVSTLSAYLAEEGSDVPEALKQLPEALRFGVADPAARTLMGGGVRHRLAAVALSRAPEIADSSNPLMEPVPVAADIIDQRDRWVDVLGSLVYDRTLEDLQPGAGR